MQRNSEIIKQFYPVMKEKCPFHEEDLQNGYREGFFDCAEYLLQKLICCENCDYHSYWGDELKCNYGLKEALVEDKLVECHNFDKWKMKSN